LNAPNWTVASAPYAYSAITPTSYLGAIESIAVASSATSSAGTGIRYSRVNGVLNSPAVIANGAGLQRIVASRRLTVAGLRAPGDASFRTRTRYANLFGSAAAIENRARFRSEATPSCSCAVVRAWR